MLKVYVLGDSISMHYGPYLARYFKGKMAYDRKTEAEEVALDLAPPHSANGGDSARVLSFLKAKAESGGLDADLLLLNCGLHDLRTDPDTGQKQVPLPAYRRNLQEIIAVAKDLDTILIWIRTTPCDEAVHNQPGRAGFHRFAADCEAYNRVADEVMAAESVPFIDLYRFTKQLGEDLYCDHVHFHNHIREKQAAFIAGWLGAWWQLTP